MMKQVIKRSVIVVFLAIFFQGNVLFAETKGQAINRAKNLSREYQYLKNLGYSLSGNALKNWGNYMLGFVYGAYQLCEELHNDGFVDFSYEVDFYFQQYQNGRRDGGNTDSYYYILGGQRSLEGKGKRMVIDDF